MCEREREGERGREDDNEKLIKTSPHPKLSRCLEGQVWVTHCLCNYSPHRETYWRQSISRGPGRCCEWRGYSTSARGTHLARAEVESREVSESSCWRVCGALLSPASQRSGEDQGSRRYGGWILRVVHLLKCCPLKWTRMTSEWQAAATKPMHFIIRTDRRWPGITVCNIRAHLMSSWTEHVSSSQKWPLTTENDHSFTRHYTHFFSLWVFMGLGHNPLTRESVCMLWTPNKVAGGNQPWVSGKNLLWALSGHLQSPCGRDWL